MGGACAEKIAVPAASCVPIPDNLDFAPAAGIIISYCTALYGLRACAKLAKTRSKPIFRAILAKPVTFWWSGKPPRACRTLPP